MNYLAHCYFADDSPESLIGNLAPDFLRSRDAAVQVAPYHPTDDAVVDGMKRHRRIDLATDSHPAFRRSCARLGGGFRHLRGIIVDVTSDHFLARHWSDYHPQPLPLFVRGVYAHLQARADLCPPLLQRALPRMIAYNWLESYITLEGVEATLDRLSHRIGRAGCFAGAVDVARAEYAGLASDFRELFADLRRQFAPAG